MSNVASVGTDTVTDLDPIEARRAARTVVAHVLAKHGNPEVHSDTDLTAIRPQVAMLLDVLGLNGREIRTNYSKNAIGSGHAPSTCG